jgi:hypothetical protein
MLAFCLQCLSVYLFFRREVETLDLGYLGWDLDTELGLLQG